MSFHSKSITDLRIGVEKRPSGRKAKDQFWRDFWVARFSTFATISAMNELMRCSKHLPHSITSSARISVAGSNRTPSSVAIFWFRTNSKCVGVSIGRSPGGMPRSIWTT